MKKTYVACELTFVALCSEDIMTTSGLLELNPDQPRYDNLDTNELPIF